MDLFYFSILIDLIEKQALELCEKEIFILEMAFELDKTEAELDEIGLFLDALEYNY